MLGDIFGEKFYFLKTEVAMKKVSDERKINFVATLNIYHNKSFFKLFKKFCSACEVDFDKIRLSDEK